MKIFFAILFLICSTNVSADESSFDFKGLTLGSDISQIENDNRYECLKGKYGETVCFMLTNEALEKQNIIIEQRISTNERWRKALDEAAQKGREYYNSVLLRLEEKENKETGKDIIEIINAHDLLNGKTAPTIAQAAVKFDSWEEYSKVFDEALRLKMVEDMGKKLNNLVMILSSRLNKTAKTDNYKKTIAGAPISDLKLFYISNKLESISIIYPSREFSNVSKALQFKYGDGEIETEILQNQMGGTFDNTIMKWRRGNATLEAKHYQETITDSVVAFYTDFFTEEFIKKLKADKAKKRADDL